MAIHFEKTSVKVLLPAIPLALAIAAALVGAPAATTPPLGCIERMEPVQQIVHPTPEPCDQMDGRRCMIAPRPA